MTWTAKLENSGLVWTLTVQNNPDGTFKFVGVAQDHGSNSPANGSWSSISAVTSQTKSGAYQVLDAHDVEFTGPNGRAVWQRQ